MYTRVESRFWQDEKMRTVSDDARYLMLYLLTSPHRNIMGFYFLPSPYACFDLGWDEKRFNKALQELLEVGTIKYDPHAHVVLIQNYLKHNALENPNQVKSAIDKLDEMPQTPLFKYFLAIIEQFDKPFMQPLIERLQERFSKPGTVTVTVTGTEKERDINSAHDEQDDADDKPDNTPQNFDAEIKRINDKSFEFGMNGITPEFMDDAEMRLKEGTDPDLIVKALSIGATKANGGSSAKCRYAISVLQAWAAERIKTLAQWEAKNVPQPKARDKPMKTKAQEREEAFRRARDEARRILREEGVIKDAGNTG